MSDFVTLKDYDTRRILELAFAAQRINNGYVKETRRYSEGQPTTWSNKEIISFSAAAYYNSSNSSTYIPSDFIPIKVTDADYAALASADKHMRRYTLLVLGNLSDFQADVFAAYASERIAVNRIGLLAYLPQFVERELEEKIYKGRLKTEFANSTAIKEKKIIGELEILKRVYSINYETYFYTAGFNGNLVMFSNKFQYKNSEVFGFKANVKSQQTDRDTGLIVNKLNYVKLVKMEN
tara:strand:- start:744 stop:1454 length:711 start_codon:yes stop_codon:yes gene_type:complete